MHVAEGKMKKEKRKKGKKQRTRKQRDIRPSAHCFLRRGEPSSLDFFPPLFFPFVLLYMYSTCVCVCAIFNVKTKK